MRVDDLSVVRAAPLLRAWYDAHARTLPWRAPPGSPPPDPYRVWLSEVMLQQTTVAAATRYFHAFTRRWPTVEALAAAEDGEVMREWAGLGYYARARNLLACARAVAAQGGRFRHTEAGLRTLQGIGRYTAAAIAAIAFDRAAVVVDANVERVVARLFAVAEPLPAARAALYDRAAALTPAERPGDHAQAMMDLGATVCTPRRPACLACPLRPLCAAAMEGDPARFPVKAAKPPRPLRRGLVWWLEARGLVLLERRPARGLLGGMLAPPASWDGAERAPPADARWRAVPGTVRHGFTHFELELTIMAARVPEPLPGRLWIPRAEVLAAGLPTLFAKAVRHALQATSDHAASGATPGSPP